MSARLNVSSDSELLHAISAEFDLRGPNKKALRELVNLLDDAEYDPKAMQVLNLATGVGKTYLMAAFIEYLRRQGVGNVMIVTPGKVVQRKTVQNFTPGSSRYISGSPVPPDVVTPQDYTQWIARVNGGAELAYGREKPALAFVFNIQQLIAPKDPEGETHGSGVDATRRRPRKFDENAGVLFDYLKGLDDLVVIADESHLYGASAVAFRAALEELDPALTVGLTASPDVSDHVVYTYPLYRAINDKFVKSPVIAFRKGGYGQDEASEEQQLRDALQLREIKQRYYDAFADSNGKSRLNAVMFVVCSDVEHASQVADLLRTPEFFGQESAVLQVDSKHDDELTQRRLEELDAPESPVRAVVSVNKLKEGWDVKNIAVIVTLRAMASEVLTQQTMGRGLRLPFGAYTGVSQIDQLDIISHQSFKELLEAEDVLRQFGLEDAASSVDKQQVQEAILRAAANVPAGVGGPDVGASNDESFLRAPTSPDQGVSAATVWPGASQIPGAGIEARSVESYGLDAGVQEPIEFVTVGRSSKFADVTYNFPVTKIRVQQPTMELFDIEDNALAAAAKRVTSTSDVLYRKEIVAALGKGIVQRDAESADIDSIRIDEEEALRVLTKLVIDMPLVPSTEKNVKFAESSFVPRFMKRVPDVEAGWTVKALDSAAMQLRAVLEKRAQELQKNAQSVTTIVPRALPGESFSLPLGERIYDQVDDASEFVQRRYYGGWAKSLFEAESFDSFTGEYQLARLLNRDPHIVWWQRLHRRHEAFVAYNAKERYFPDFVALDDAGIHWIIEAKDERGRDDEKVQAKRKAAESLVLRLGAEDGFDDQRWGYLIAYESDIKQASSWADLKALADPVNNAV